MRPIRLTMTAFGPYAGTEVVDFREATDSGLFGIYGATGSGKSSIFSAMTFALFGEGAKKEQPIATMRSGHADSDRMTEVSLLFELGGKRYYVRRQPDQSRPKRRGEGETKDGHKAWLFDATAVPIEDVTAERCGTVLAETKVIEVGRQVRELLGYGVEQFRQIVLLPQGRFEQFLVADSGQRVEILRELFDVSVYRRLAMRMRDDAVAARREFDTGHRVVVERLAQAGFESTDALADGIAAADEISEARRADATLADDIAARAERAHATGEAVEARFGRLEQAEGRTAELAGRSEEIEAVQAVLTRARKASRAVDLATRSSELATARDDAIDAESLARARAGETEAEHRRAEEAAKRERGNAPRLEALVTRAVELERLGNVLASAADLKERWSESGDRRREAQETFDQLDETRDGLETELAGLTVTIAGTRAADLKRAELTTELAVARIERGTSKAHQDADRRTTIARDAVEKARVKRDAAVAEVQPLRDDADGAERAFIDAQAQVLASEHLVEGQPCPVCGSEEHPSPAGGDGEPRALETRMREVRRRLEEAVREAHRAEAAFAAAEAGHAERVADLEALAAPRLPLADAEVAVSRIEERIAALGEPLIVADLEEEASRVEQMLTAAESRTSEAREALQRARTDEAVAKRSYEDAIAGVPEGSRLEGALAEEAAETADAIAALRDARDSAEEALRTAASTRDTTAAKAIGAAEAVVRAEGEVTRARSAFDVRLAELDLDPRSYELGCADIPDIDAHAERIRVYREDVVAADAEAASARAAAEGFVRPDLSALAAARDASRADCIEARRVASEADAARKALDELLAALRGQLDRLARLEAETGPLRGLADAFAGENPMRIPLEMFAIGTMFDHVLDAANLRLDPMTGGRYRLIRDVETVGGRSKRGLDIRVHDIQTGRPREISTLSGGETFIAALSLALGLSDVVEMSHGRIRLDTIFIDEGFGSLDTENDSGTLDRVLQVLQEIVGRNRAVGLISHVPMVQHAVPNGFSVVKGVDGSRVERRVA